MTCVDAEEQFSLTSSVMVRKVTTLAHEVGNHAMED